MIDLLTETKGKRMQLAARQSEVATGGRSKVEHYKWVMTGSPGKLEYLPKTALVVDHSYQRHAKNARVIKLARRWNWLACGVLIVALRNGIYYVVDGQHRLMAALKRSDIDELPCLVFASEEARDEAVAFRDTNKERRPITTFEQWNAELTAQDWATLYVNALITNSGRVPADQARPNSVRCLSSLVSAARNNREELDRLWPLITRLCEGAVLHERLFQALMYLECNLDEGQSLTNSRWAQKLLKIGHKGILDATARASAFYAKGGPKVWALGVMQELNKGSRVNVLAMRGGE